MLKAHLQWKVSMKYILVTHIKWKKQPMQHVVILTQVDMGQSEYYMFFIDYIKSYVEVDMEYSGDDTVQTKLSRRSPQNWTLFWTTFKIQTNNALHFNLIETGVGYWRAIVRIPLLKPKWVHQTGCAVSAIYALCAGTAAPDIITENSSSGHGVLLNSEISYWRTRSGGQYD